MDNVVVVAGGGPIVFVVWEVRVGYVVGWIVFFREWLSLFFFGGHGRGLSTTVPCGIVIGAGVMDNVMGVAGGGPIVFVVWEVRDGFVVGWTVFFPGWLSLVFSGGFNAATATSL